MYRIGSVKYVYCRAVKISFQPGAFFTLGSQDIRAGCGSNDLLLPLSVLFESWKSEFVNRFNLAWHKKVSHRSWSTWLTGSRVWVTLTRGNWGSLWRRQLPSQQSWRFVFTSTPIKHLTADITDLLPEYSESVALVIASQISVFQSFLSWWLLVFSRIE